MQLKYIFEGYFKLFYDFIFRKSSQKSKMRYSICKQCIHNKNGICQLCGCIIKAKIKVDFIEDENGISIDGCPEKKW